MSAYRTETTTPEKLPLWIDPRLHREIKKQSAHRSLSIKDYVESVLYKALFLDGVKVKKEDVIG